MTTLYDDLVAIGAEISNHESDLYTPYTAEAVALVKRHGLSSRPFTSAIDGRLMIEVPFSFAPFWRQRAAKGAA
ncbi:MAG: hypothetical protein IT190_10705 [Microbacteriaceae bacterium]|nr:hypothetical protein [Microbacteriaceae bacterium]